ncbi:hypothetical protein PIROE2DRAFT_1982 [Piromyces sp. E2]|nr:hypothetical protein PIROE2DRAFT_1982 [Piromyces sp. E2]|eukprot:OUM70033.1 hypothetical protein PIROE2DRAFT_1982 [Piromyces sp. E2]
MVITKYSQYKEEVFDFIEIFLNDKYPYYSESNISITPIENIRGHMCEDMNDSKISKLDQCNSMLSSDGTFPNNLPMFERFNNKSFKCGNNADFENSYLTYYEKYRIEFPLNNNKTLILKSMADMDNNQNFDEQTPKIKCSIFDETFKKAKPMQFPYSHFPEMDKLESKSPISLLFAHLYYKHNTTNEGSFEDIMNETCDTMDYIFTPPCQDTSKVIYTFGECYSKNQTMPIIFKNCRYNDIEYSDLTYKCTYLEYTNIKGYIIMITIFISCYSIKADIIISVYNNSSFDISIKKYKMHYFYISLLIVQILILSIWTKGSKIIVKNEIIIEKYGKADYEYDSCSYSNNKLLNVVFCDVFVILLNSLILSYKGRKSK